MVSRKVIVRNAEGLHLRPAGDLSRTAQQFKSEISIVHNGSRKNAKSLLQLLGACIKYGDEVEFICEGVDEQNALEEMLCAADRLTTED